MDVTPATPYDRGAHRGPLGDRLAREPRMLPEDARRSNRGLILRALHHGGPASRADLAKLVGLTPATVSAVIKELLEAGLVDELGRTSGAIGEADHDAAPGPEAVPAPGAGLLEAQHAQRHAGRDQNGAAPVEALPAVHVGHPRNAATAG